MPIQDHQSHEPYSYWKQSGVHLRSTLEDFLLPPTPLETQWMLQTRNIPTLTPTPFLTYFHNLILQNILETKHITHPNGTHLMTNDEFTHYYTTPNKIGTNCTRLWQTTLLWTGMPQSMQWFVLDTNCTKHLDKWLHKPKPTHPPKTTTTHQPSPTPNTSRAPKKTTPIHP